MLSSCSLHFNCILAKDIHNIFLYVQAVNQLLTNMVKKTYRHGVSKFYVLSINYLNLIAYIIPMKFDIFNICIPTFLFNVWNY